MKRARYWIAVSAFVAFLAICWALPTHQPIEFTSVEEASVNIAAAGFHCTSDRSDGIIQSGFLVTKEEIGWREANDLCKVGKMGPEWKGKVWVSYMGVSGALVVVPEDASSRSWGGVCAFGDADLLNQLEYTLRHSL